MVPIVPPRWRVLALRAAAPILLAMALVAWAMSSAVGSSPDDDFHLASIWCGHGANPPGCEPGESADDRAVNLTFLTNAVCFAFNSDASAACQGEGFASSFEHQVVTTRGNFDNLYPPVFYWTMSWFAGENIEATILSIRVVNAHLFTALSIALFALLPSFRRSNFVWSLAITFVPLSAYLIASNNPSSWAVISAGTLWIALIGYFETTGARRIGLATIALVSTVLGSGARADSALFAVLAVGLAILLTLRRRREYLIQAIFPLSLAVVSLGLYLTSHQGPAAAGGLGEIDANMDVNPVTLAIANLVNLPSLWVGVFGYWPLGWLDTEMPAGVWVPAFAAFAGAFFLGLHLRVPRKGLALSIIALALVMFPVVLLVRSQSMVGANFQPRYLLPLVILLAGILLFHHQDARPRLTPASTWLVVGSLGVANAIALHTQIRRYVTGTDVHGINLDADAEWWWQLPITPMMTWIAGSLAFIALLAIINSRTWNAAAPYHRERDALSL